MATVKEQLADVQASLDQANQKVDNVAADVQRLHDQINNVEGLPTQEEWDAVKSSAATLNAKLQAVDDATPE